MEAWFAVGSVGRVGKGACCRRGRRGLPEGRGGANDVCHEATAIWSPALAPDGGQVPAGQSRYQQLAWPHHFRGWPRNAEVLGPHHTYSALQGPLVSSIHTSTAGLEASIRGNI